MSAIWQPIPFTAGLHNTAVLLKYRKNTSGLSLHLTDLSQVWSVELDKQQICEKALKIGCSIDPSEDDSQLAILLDTFEGALRGDDGTSIAIIVDGPDHLKLTISSPLPAPLPALMWPFRLGPASREQVKSEVMVPLVCSTYMRKQQQDDLTALLAHKDALISKLIDKVESIGSDLVSLFPNLGRLSHTKNQRQQLAKYVKGLEPFDASKWRKQFDATVHDGLAFHEMSAVAFQESGTPAVDGLLSSLNELISVPLPELLRTGKAKGVPKLAREQTKDEFQHQITPKKVRAKRGVIDDNETTDDEGTASPTPGPRSAKSMRRDGSPTKSTPGSTRKLGQIGGLRQSAQKAAQLSSPTAFKTVAQPRKTSAGLGGESSSDHDNAMRISPTPPARNNVATAKPAQPTPTGESDSSHSPATTVEAPDPPRRRLGRIGRSTTPAPVRPPARAGSEVPPNERAASEVAQPSQTAQAPRTPRKLGMIGGRRKNSTQAASQNESQGMPAASQDGEYKGRSGTQTQPANEHVDEARTPSPVRQKTPEENPDEKANRRRRELEREMSKEKTPTKKRRRF